MKVELSLGRSALVFLVLLMLPVLALAHPSGYNYYKDIEVNTSKTLNDYQYLVNLSYSSKMANDFSDIAFTNSTSDTLLPFWIESKSDGVYADVYVRGNYKTTNGTQLRVYYNKTGATSLSNLSTTATFFDDFENGTNGYEINRTIPDVNKWIVYNGSGGSVGYSSFAYLDDGMAKMYAGGDNDFNGAIVMAIKQDVPTDVKVFYDAIPDGTYSVEWQYFELDTGIASSGTRSGSNGYWSDYALEVGNNPSGGDRINVYYNIANNSGAWGATDHYAKKVSSSWLGATKVELTYIDKGGSDKTLNYTIYGEKFGWSGGNLTNVTAGYNRTYVSTNAVVHGFDIDNYTIFHYTDTPPLSTFGNEAMVPPPTNCTGSPVSTCEGIMDGGVCSSSYNFNTNQHCVWTILCENRDVCTLPVNEAPSIALISPDDSAINISLQPNLTATINDTDSYYIDIAFYNASDDGIICSFTGEIANITLNCNWTGANRYHAPPYFPAIYYWYVKADDGTNITQSETRSFTTTLATCAGNMTTDCDLYSDGNEGNPSGNASVCLEHYIDYGYQCSWDGAGCNIGSECILPTTTTTTSTTTTTTPTTTTTIPSPITEDVLGVSNMAVTAIAVGFVGLIIFAVVLSLKKKD